VSGTYLARGAGDLAKTIYNLREHLWSRLGSNQSPRRANALNGPRRPSRVTGRLRRSPLSRGRCRRSRRARPCRLRPSRMRPDRPVHMEFMLSDPALKNYF